MPSRLADVHVVLHNGLGGDFMNAAGFIADEARLEELHWATKIIATYCICVYKYEYRIAAV